MSKITLTSDQMARIWRSRAAIEPSDSDGSMEQFDAVDVQAAILFAQRKWYLELLDNAPVRHLALTDVTDRLKAGDAFAGRASFSLPTDVRRLTSLCVASWPTPITVLTDPPNVDEILSPTLRMLSNTYARAADFSPRAVVTDRRLTVLYPTSRDSTPLLTSVMGVVDPGDEEFTMDESALALIDQAVAHDALINALALLR